LRAFKEGAVEVRESGEEAVVAKAARVVEEVDVSKEVSRRREKVSDKARRGEVEVQQLGGSSDYDSDYRRHWNSNFASIGGSYDEYAPAYSYGSDLASSGRYTGRAWDEIEPEVRKDWETRHPGSAWERFKASIRYGWETLTGSTRADSSHSTRMGEVDRPGNSRMQ
jgi:hypothetical protein